MSIAFSFTNRPRLGQAKGGLGFNTQDLAGFRNHARSTYLDRAHVGWTSMSNSET